jgi:hypothetical protein
MTRWRVRRNVDEALPLEIRPGLMNRIIYAVIFAVALAACGGGKVVLRAQPVDSAEVHVIPLEVYLSGKKLWVRINVQNTSQGTLIIQRDAMLAHLPNGQTLTRAMGSWGLHEPYVLPPGAMHPVYVEFEAQGFKWQDMPGAQIDFANGVTLNGQPIVVPPFTVSR